MSNDEQTSSTIDEPRDEEQTTLDSQDEAESSSGTDTPNNAARIAELEEALIEAKEASLRAAAEAQNIRRRAEQDVEKAHKFGLEKFVNALLPVVDNLERSLDAAAADGADPQALSEGVALTLKSFVDALKSHKVEVVAPEGEPFDPALHQAISAVVNPETEANTVLSVVQKGYTLHGRLVRPAMVVVSKVSA